MGDTFSPKDQRIIVRYLITQNKDQTEIHKLLTAVAGEGAVSYKVVKQWIQDCKDGKGEGDEQSLENAQLESDSVGEVPTDPALVARIEFLINGDRRISADRAADMSISTKHQAQQIIKHVLGLKKVCERWVPRLWTPEQRNYRVSICQELFDQYQTEDMEFLSRMVFADETFNHYYHADNLHVQSTPSQPQRHHSVGEKYRPAVEPITMNFIFFFDVKGFIAIHEVQENYTPDAEYYSKIIKEELVPMLAKKRKGRRPEEILLCHDNTPNHYSTTVQTVLRELNIPTMPHPPASPDLEPQEYWLYPYLKEELRKNKFNNKQGLVNAIHHHINNITESKVSGAIKRLPDRWSRCIENNGLYVL